MNINECYKFPNLSIDFVELIKYKDNNNNYKGCHPYRICHLDTTDQECNESHINFVYNENYYSQYVKDKNF